MSFPTYIVTTCSASLFVVLFAFFPTDFRCVLLYERAPYSPIEHYILYIMQANVSTFGYFQQISILHLDFAVCRCNIELKTADGCIPHLLIPNSQFQESSKNIFALQLAISLLILN